MIPLATSTLCRRLTLGPMLRRARIRAGITFQITPYPSVRVFTDIGPNFGFSGGSKRIAGTSGRNYDKGGNWQ